MASPEPCPGLWLGADETASRSCVDNNLGLGGDIGQHVAAATDLSNRENRFRKTSHGAITRQSFDLSMGQRVHCLVCWLVTHVSLHPCGWENTEHGREFPLALLLSSFAVYFASGAVADRAARVAAKILSSGTSADSSGKLRARHAGRPPSITATLPGVIESN